jgi:hypothetical protein
VALTANLALGKAASQSSTLSVQTGSSCCCGKRRLLAPSRRLLCCTYFSATYDAANAVDGAYACAASMTGSSGSCHSISQYYWLLPSSAAQAVTSNEVSPWWTVDLGFFTRIGTVRLFSTDAAQVVVWAGLTPEAWQLGAAALCAAPNGTLTLVATQASVDARGWWRATSP